MHSSIALIVGLGNPGTEYVATRHNVGAWFVNSLVEQYKVTLQLEKKFFGLYGTLETQGMSCKLLLPTTFMNLSGQAIQTITAYYKIPLNAVLVAHDELDFSPGDVRLKYSGGHGGHNGLRDIIARFGNKDFYRLRIGIGHPGNKNLVTDYVLSRPSVYDKNKILNSIERTLTVLPDILYGNIDKAMQMLN